MPLRQASWTGVLDIMDWLLNHKVDVNAQGHHGYTPLHSAAAEGQAGQLQAFQMLIEHNANIHIRNDFGLTVLHVAAASNQCHRDHINIMQVLLDHSADPNAQDNNNSTPLHHSSWWQTGDYDGTVVIRPIRSSDPAGALAPIIRSIGCIRSSRSRLIVLITALYTYLDTITVLIDISILGYTEEAILWTVVLTPFCVLVT